MMMNFDTGSAVLIKKNIFATNLSCYPTEENEGADLVDAI